DYSNTSTASSGGRYLVIAGTYRQRVNADNMVTRLKRMGYNDAEVELFDHGTYAVVIVNRYSSLSRADQLSTELKNKGVEAFVKDNG
ncbi:MAG: SPOR domain-containing protein, partial [Lewinella sp.]|nr:SPOR domain-containing protein [Lewinella sp.]